MSMTTRCTVCGEATERVTFPVIVRRESVEILRLTVPARACTECSWVMIDDRISEEVVATLEAQTEPGDDIVFPEDAELH